MKEADYKSRLVADINRRPGCFAQRLEDKYAVGVLDLIIKLPGYPTLFAEAKWIRAGFKFAPSGIQYEKGKKMIAARMQVGLMAWKNGQLYLSPWVEFADIRDCPQWRGQSEIEQIEDFLYELGRQPTRQADHEWPLQRHVRHGAVNEDADAAGDKVASAAVERKGIS